MHAQPDARDTEHVHESHQHEWHESISVGVTCIITFYGLKARPCPDI